MFLFVVCLVLAEDAIKAALADFKVKQKQGTEEQSAQKNSS